MDKVIEHKKLKAVLRSLCKKSIDLIIAYRDENNLVAVTYQHLPIKEIDYDRQSYRYDWGEIKYFDYYTWENKNFKSFFELKLKALREFDIVCKLIIAEFNLEDEAMEVVKEIGLATLLHLIMRNVPNREITHENIDKYIDLFIQDYNSFNNDSPILWKVELWLNNIYLQSNEIEIYPGVFLRRPNEFHLQEIKPKRAYIDEFEKITGKQLVFGAVLSFSISAPRNGSFGIYPKEIGHKIEYWLNILMLFKPSDVRVVYQKISPVSLFESQISENKQEYRNKYWINKVEHSNTSIHKFSLQKKQERQLKKFVLNIGELISEHSKKSYLNGDAYDLAFHRYFDSLLESEISVYRILSSITSLEALFSENPSDIVFKLRLRMAKLLSFLKHNPLHVSSVIKDAYALRSRLVHGTAINSKKNTNFLKFAKVHINEILDYNRVCLLVFLQLKKTISKENLIKLIDDSLIDDNSEKHLRKLVQETNFNCLKKNDLL